MSVSKISVPCDFGVENLHDEFHGNITISLEGSSNMKASSLILSWNSSVFKYLFCDLKQSVVDITDFSKDVVNVFLEGLYSGSINIDQSKFREIHKIAHVFKVEWMVAKCVEAFKKFCKASSLEYTELLFLFNEAVYSEQILKCPILMEIMVTSFASVADSFVEQYLRKNFENNTPITLKHLLEISENHYAPILRALNNHLQSESRITSSLHNILLSDRVLQCLTKDIKLYDEILDVVLKKFDQSNPEDVNLLKSLYKAVRRQDDDSSNSIASSTPASRCPSFVPCQKVINNVFYDWKTLCHPKDNDFVARLFQQPGVSVFMALEFLYYYIKRIDMRQKSLILANIAATCSSLSLCKVPPVFIERFTHPGRLHGIPESVISMADTHVIDSGGGIQLYELLTQGGLYKFNLHHSKCNLNKKTSECGFILKVSPVIAQSRKSFKIELTTDEKDYPPDLHCHEDSITAANMHVVIEEFYHGAWSNMCVTWRGCVRYMSRAIEWDGFRFDAVPPQLVRLVVYYDMRGS